MARRKHRSPDFHPLVERDPQRHPLLPYHCLDRGRTTHRVGRAPWTEEDHLLPYHPYSHIGIDAIVVSCRAICAFMAAHPHADTHSTRRTRRAQRRVRVILAATFAVALRLQIVDDQERLPQVIEQQVIAEFSNDDFGVAWTARDPSWNWGWETDWNGWGTGTTWDGEVSFGRWGGSHGRWG
ncbi:hypothetical protein DFH08DRAFT_874932, partial [Mycena albidolilacea]